jgi:riboflavin synthase
MFTGLIEATGRIVRVDGTPAGCRIVVSAPFATQLAAGDSVAVNGVCLTAAAVEPSGFAADLSRATLEATSLGSLRTGTLVNLERPLRASSPVGGHFVLGHVDQTSRIVSLAPDGDGHWLEVALPAALEPYVVPKGSIAIDGVSLTVAALDAAGVGVQIVPFTWAHTALQEASVGDVVNLETDVLGKYVVRAMALGDRLAASAAALERQLQ